ncbi:MAG: DUF4340 domain-containing protein [Lachnobacterium sp.]|nr:DUF4340 domain-containing protein [uncultured Agathobacter sp.]MCI7112173.1 DUF4340 domain-containing protein [Lachnobacterium sp.]
MNKQKRLFIILVVVLIVCLAGYMGLLHYNKYKSDDSESESTSVEALSIESSTVRSFSFDINGEQYTFSRVQAAGDKSIEDSTEESEESISSGTDSTEESESSETEDVQWVCDNDPELKLNTSKITTMLGCITSITASEKFDADTDVSDFGFDTPQNTITMTTDDNTYTIVVGAKNAMLSQYYIKVNDDVYLSSTTIPSQFAVTLDDMIQSDDSEDTETTAE